MTRTTRVPLNVLCAACSLAIVPGGRAAGQAPPLDSAKATAELRSACGSRGAAAGFGLLRGEVLDSDSHPVPAAAVTIGWHRRVDGKPGAARPDAGTDDAVLGGLSDGDGHWQICGAPMHTALSVRAAGDEGSDASAATLDEAHPVASLDLALRVRERAGGAAGAPSTNAIVVFSVEDREGRTLGGIKLTLQPARGPAREVQTDSLGRAILPSIEPGRARVTSLGLGYRPGEVFVPLDPGRNTVPLILDAVHIPALATIRVIGDRQVLARHQEFESRRSLHQATASITAEDIAKRNPIDTWQMLTTVPSMRVMEYGSGLSGVYAMSTREQPVVQRRDAVGGGVTMPCWYKVMIDGMLVPDPMPDLSTILPPPSEVHGIEVFAGLATIPPKYSGSMLDENGQSRSNTCGLIVVWTK